MRPSASALPIAATLLLAGCVQDTASYMIDGDRNHSIIVMRSQNLPWSSQIAVAVTAARQPDCLGGLDIEGATRDTELVLHRAPEEYAEPIFILAVGTDYYAVSTQSCRVQKFKEAPADKGPEVGRFKETDGRFQYVAAGK